MKKKTHKRAGLVYIGLGFLPGVPAKDLTAAEINDLVARGHKYEYLLASGLYRPDDQPDDKEGE